MTDSSLPSSSSIVPNFSFAECKKIIGDFDEQEVFDYFFYRPISYVLIKLLGHFPITPNHVSFTALGIAMLSGYLFTKGTPVTFAWGAIGILLFNILDCCDGMLARYKRNGSPNGQYIDMVVDILSSFCFYVGTWYGVKHAPGIGPESVFPLFLIPFLILHVGVYQYKRRQLNFLMTASYEEALARKEKNGAKWKTLFLYNFGENSPSSSSSDSARPGGAELIEYQRKKHQLNILKYKRELPWWSAISGSSHLTILALSILGHHLDIYYFYSAIFANIWLFGMGFKKWVL